MEQNMRIVVSCLIALFAMLFCVLLLKPLAVRLDLVDQPGGRKKHAAPVPLIGGLAMFFGFCFSLLSLNFPLSHYRGLIAGSALLILIGLVDDFRELGSKLRLAGQIIAVLFLVGWGHVTIESLGNIFFLGTTHLSYWAIPITIFSVLGYLNSMNMIDGQDGLSGSIALAQVLVLLLFSMELHAWFDTMILMMLGVNLIGFLFFNLPLPWRKHASIFMGDAGVTFVAFVIAWFAIDLSQMNITLVKPIAVLWVLAFPIFDLINVMLHRLLKGKSPLVADRNHIHHILNLYGINVTVSTLMLSLFSFAMGLVGFFLNQIGMSDAWLFIILCIILVIYYLIVSIVRKPVSNKETSDLKWA